MSLRFVDLLLLLFFVAVSMAGLRYLEFSAQYYQADFANNLRLVGFAVALGSSLTMLWLPKRDDSDERVLRFTRLSSIATILFIGTLATMFEIQQYGLPWEVIFVLFAAPWACLSILAIRRFRGQNLILLLYGLAVLSVLDYAALQTLGRVSFAEAFIECMHYRGQFLYGLTIALWVLTIIRAVAQRQSAQADTLMAFLPLIMLIGAFLVETGYELAWSIHSE